jgi:FlgD Ig-like domain
MFHSAVRNCNLPTQKHGFSRAALKRGGKMKLQNPTWAASFFQAALTLPWYFNVYVIRQGPPEFFSFKFVRWLTVTWLLSLAIASQAANSSFSFTLDEPCKTSAGVYTSDGTLIRTLWSKVRYYAAGTYAAAWDGLDDSSNAAPAGVYQIKLLQHNTEYVWDGAIGNTSAELSGPTVHQGFYPVQDMAIIGTNAFYVSGYNEGRYNFRSFITTDPQHMASGLYWCYSPEDQVTYEPLMDINQRSWTYVAADSNWVYFAASTTRNSPYSGCVIACNLTNYVPAYFSNGVTIDNGNGQSFSGALFVGTQPGLSGISVQQNGNLLAISVAPDNKVYLVDKRSGSAVANFNITHPERLNFSPDGSLWVISSNKTLVCYTNVGISPAVALIISSLSEPLDVAVNPTNANIILVADGGTSQQVKAFNSSGTLLWTYGLAGGYQANGVAVQTNKFWFSLEGVDQTFLCFAPDGSFWVGDEENHRSLHFSGDRNYIEQIMYQPLSYADSVDPNNPSRVFNQFLEFKVDYTKPLPQAWTLVNNWKVNVDASHISSKNGLYEVTTFTNGRTYALIDNTSSQPGLNFKELCELVPTNGLRFTGIFPAAIPGNGWNSLGSDGSARFTTIGSAAFYEAILNGFDSSNNPLWNQAKIIASAPNGATDPVSRGFGGGDERTTISTNNVLISFDQSLNNGWHLGGIKVGSTNWLWKVSPTGDLNGCGNYEIDNGITYAGNNLEAIDRNVIYGYNGEFFRNSGQAAQYMHYYDDGLFVGQFGESSIQHLVYDGAIPGFAGNDGCPVLMKTTKGDYYLWANDESSHAPPTLALC